MNDPGKLRELAGWYRDLAERTADPVIWEARLLTAEDLETEAARLDTAVPEEDAASVLSATLASN